MHMDQFALNGGGEPAPVDGRCKSKNLDAERRRRAKLKENHLALRSLVPNITKMSKESTLTDAADYIKRLLEQVRGLEKELDDRQVRDDHLIHASGTVTTPLEPAADQSIKRTSAEDREEEEEGVAAVQAEMDVSAIGRNGFHVRMLSKKGRSSLMGDLVEEVAGLDLEITNASFTSIGGVCRITFSAEWTETANVETNKRNGNSTMEELKRRLKKML